MDIPVSRDRVWEAWTTPPGLRQWLCREAVVMPAVGGPYEMLFEPGGSHATSAPPLLGRVLSIDRPRLLQFGGSDGGNRFVVIVELFPTLDGTRVEVTHSFLGDELRSPLCDRFDPIWTNGLEQLRTLFQPYASYGEYL